MLTFHPFGQFAPDQSFYHNPALGVSRVSRTVLNVTPQNVETVQGQIQVTYRPFLSFTPYRTGLSKRCQGALSFFASNGNVMIFAGDQNRLYRLTVTRLDWSNISGQTYGVDPDAYWYFTTWGDQIIATNYTDSVQIYQVGLSNTFTELANGGVTSLVVTPGSGYTNGTNYALTPSGGNGHSFTGLIDVVGGELTNPRILTTGSSYTSIPTINVRAGPGSGGSIVATIADIAPRARYIATVRDFVVLGFTLDAVDGIQSQRVWWSRIANPTGWPTPGTDAAVQVQSDFQTIPGVQGDLVGIFPNVGTNDAVLVFNRAMHSMRYVGSPAIFEFNPIQGVKGSYAPKSIVQEGSFLYLWREMGFISFDGSNSTPIGLNRVDQKLRDEVNPSQIDRIIGMSDPAYQAIIWAYPGPNSQNGIPDTLLIYRYALDVWSEVHPGPMEFIFRGTTFGYTLESLAVIYPQLELIPASLDSPQWSQNILTMSAFDNTHRMGYFSGLPLTPTIDTSMFQWGDGVTLPTDQRALVLNTRPIFDGLSTQAITQIGYTETLNTPLKFTNPVRTNRVGLAPTRARGRYFVGRVSTTNTAWNILVGIEMDLRLQGRR